MKKWLTLFLLPIAAVYGQGELYFNVDPKENEILDNLALDPSAIIKVEDFDSQQLTFLEEDEKDPSLKFWIEGNFSAEKSNKSLDDLFTFEKPLCSDFQPSLENIPEDSKLNPSAL